MNGMEGQASVASDMAIEIGVMRETMKVREAEVSGIKTMVTEQESVVKEVVMAKDRVEVKASAKEMEDKLRISTTQFKVMDLELGKETEDRKEIINLGMAEIRRKIRQDHVNQFDELVKDVDCGGSPSDKEDFQGNWQKLFLCPASLYCSG
jgi:hypothetical protein